MNKLRLPANVAFIGFIGTKFGVFNAMMAFVATGAIPGTGATIPSGFMLLATITGLWLLILGFVLPRLVRRHTLQIQPPVKAPEIIPVDTIVYTSCQPDFRLFSPVVHVGR